MGRAGADIRLPQGRFRVRGRLWLGLEVAIILRGIEGGIPMAEGAKRPAAD